MKRSDQLVEILKSEGLQIVDEEGFDFESREQNDQQWQDIIDHLDLNLNYADCPIEDIENGEELNPQIMKRLYSDRVRLKAFRKNFIHTSRGILIPYLLMECYFFIRNSPDYSEFKLHKDRMGFDFTHTESRWDFYVRWNEGKQTLAIEVNQGMIGESGHCKSLEEFKDWAILIED